MSLDISRAINNYDQKELMRELNRLDYEDDFYSFFRAGWKYIDPSEFSDGIPLEAVTQHLEAVASGDIKRLIINIPPRMSKSSMTSVAFPAWVWAQRHESPTSGPGVQFLHASYSQQLSLRDSVKCRRLIESPWYQEYWGDRFQLSSDQNAKSRFDNTRTGTRLCTSVGSTLTGEGGNIIIVDDPNAAQEAFSEATIATTIEWWDTALSTRLNDPKSGAFVIIQQRLAENDLTGHILSKDIGNWTHLMLPMRFEPERSFHTSIGWQDWRTERFGEPEVKSLEATLGPWAAAGQLQQRPEVKGGGIIKRDWWQPWNEPNYPAFDYIIAALDTAYTTKQENDFSALTVWGIFSEDNVAQSNNILRADGSIQAVKRTYGQLRPKAFLMFAWQMRLEIFELVAKVQETCKRFKVDKLLIENKAAGISVSQELRRLYATADFAVQLVDPGNQDKLARLYSVQHLFSEGMVYAPDKSWADQVMTQCAVFPKGKNDDLVDTASMAMNHLRKIGMLQRAEEIDNDLDGEMKNYGSNNLPPLYSV
jgi:predicted phage terminase large subunit-like protein